MICYYLNYNLFEFENISSLICGKNINEFSAQIKEKIKVNFGEFDLRKELKFMSKMRNAKISLSNKNVRFCYLIQEDIPKKIFIDFESIKKMIFLLINNSIKFTNNGDILLKIYTNNNILIFVIRDKGIGIKQADLNNIGNEYFKVKNSNNEYGIGLGFSIFKSYLLALDGYYEIFSKVGIGPKIILYIPLKSNTKSEYKLFVNDKSLENEFNSFTDNKSSLNNLQKKLKHTKSWEHNSLQFSRLSKYNDFYFRSISSKNVQLKLKNSLNNIKFSQEKIGLLNSINEYLNNSVPSVKETIRNDNIIYDYNYTNDKGKKRENSLQMGSIDDSYLYENNLNKSFQGSCYKSNYFSEDKKYERKLSDRKSRYLIEKNENRIIYKNKNDSGHANNIISNSVMNPCKNIYINNNKNHYPKGNTNRHNNNINKISEIFRKDTNITKERQYLKNGPKKYIFKGPNNGINKEIRKTTITAKYEVTTVRRNESDFIFDIKYNRDIGFSIPNTDISSTNKKFTCFIKSEDKINFNNKHDSNFANDNNLRVINILFVDDEDLIRRSNINYCKKYQSQKFICNAEEASDGIEALYKVYQSFSGGFKYNIIITDETMTVMKGSLMAKIIKTFINENIFYDLLIGSLTSYEISSFDTNTSQKIFDFRGTKPISKYFMDNIFDKYNEKMNCNNIYSYK